MPSGFTKGRFRSATMIWSSCPERSEPTATAMTATQAWQIVWAVAARVWERRSERTCNVSDLRLKFEQEEMSMLQTVEAEIDIYGNVRLLEPLRVTKPTRALLTLLEDTTAPAEDQGNVAELLKLLQSPEFANRRSYPPEEIEARIQENRDSWE
jgi:hypothetical protein